MKTETSQHATSQTSPSSDPQPSVRLRAVEPEDLDALYDIENDPSLWNVGTTNVPYSKYILRDYVAHATCDIYADRQVRLMVENHRQQVVAIVDIVNFEPQHLRAELGLVVKNEFRRQGYANVIVSNIIDYAQRIIHLHQIYVIIQSNNEAALQLFYHHHFHHQATLSEWLFDGHDYHDAYVLQRIL